MSTLRAYYEGLRDFRSAYGEAKPDDELIPGRDDLCDACGADDHDGPCEPNPGDCFVAEEDREPPVLVGMFDEIPMPRDPYGCANPVSEDEE